MVRVREIGLAPMAGYTDEVLRKIAIDCGADFSFSEMLSAEGVLRNDFTTSQIVPSSPCRIQLFGSEPGRIAEAAFALRDVATWIDINAGCPVKKVTKQGSGSALLNDLPRLQDMVKTVKAAVEVPVSVKIRIGWKENRLDEIMAALLEVEPAAVFIHGRTKEQAYTGVADWDPIGRVVSTCKKKGVKIFGSGDLFTPERIAELLQMYDLDGVIVARGVIGNPWIFAQTKELLKKGFYKPTDPEDRLRFFFGTHLARLVELKGEARGIVESRKFFSGYCRGMPNSSVLRNSFMRAKTLEDVRAIITASGIAI